MSGGGKINVWIGLGYSLLLKSIYGSRFLDILSVLISSVESYLVKAVLIFLLMSLRSLEKFL